MHVMPLAGWLFRVPPYTGGRLVNGCDWLTPVRLEGRPLNNPPRIALDAAFVCSGIGLLTPYQFKSQEMSCRGQASTPARVANERYVERAGTEACPYESLIIVLWPDS